jgi:hypothetical protein
MKRTHRGELRRSQYLTGTLDIAARYPGKELDHRADFLTLFPCPSRHNTTLQD